MNALILALKGSAVLASLSLCPLQAKDPSPPPGGFKIQWQRNVLLTWSDQYRTRIDIAYPQRAAPSSGWPGVLVVHGGGRSRKVGWAQETMRRLATAGFVAFGYDVRGQGDCPRLNPQHGQNRFTHLRRTIDMADCFHLLGTRLSGVLDPKRLGVYGQSQGGSHGLHAAAYSGLALPGKGYRKTMPKILAVVTDVQVLDRLDDLLPGGTLFQAAALAGAFAKTGTKHGIVQAFLKDDPVAARKALLAEPGLIIWDLLKKSDTPLFLMNSWDDGKHIVRTNANALARMKPGVPRRLLLSTGGHHSVLNYIEDLLGFESTQRWMSRFLKGEQNGIDKEPLVDAAVIPANPRVYLDPRSQWQHRRSRTWPITKPSRRFYLRSGKRLLSSAPSSTETVASLNHRVRRGYGALQFLKDGANLRKVLPAIPQQKLPFNTAAVSKATELFGRAVCELELTPTRSSFQVVATLYDIDPQGNARFITTGSVGVRGTSSARQRVRIELDDVAYILPAGHRFRLSLENLHLYMQPKHPRLFAAPFFHSYRLQPHIDRRFAPRLDLPLRTLGLSLTPRIGEINLSGAWEHSLSIEGGQDRAGQVYILLVGGSGITPGMPGSPRIPLNFDAWTHLGLAAINTPVFDRFLGRLDRSGRALAKMRVPANLSSLTLGSRLSFTALTLTPNSFESSWTGTLHITR